MNQSFIENFDNTYFIQHYKVESNIGEKCFNVFSTILLLTQINKNLNNFVFKSQFGTKLYWYIL